MPHAHVCLLVVCGMLTRASLLSAARSRVPPGHKLAQLHARIRDMRTNRGFRAAKPARDLLAREIFDVAKHTGGARARGQLFKTCGEPVALLGPDERSFGVFRVIVGRFGDLAEGDAPVAAEEIESGIGSDAGKPVCGFLLVLQLILTLESFDESFLRKVLGVMDVANDAINLEENTTEMLGNETFFEFDG